MLWINGRGMYVLYYTYVWKTRYYFGTVWSNSDGYFIKKYTLFKKSRWATILWKTIGKTVFVCYYLWILILPLFFLSSCSQKGKKIKIFSTMYWFPPLPLLSSPPSGPKLLYYLKLTEHIIGIPPPSPSSRPYGKPESSFVSLISARIIRA